MPERNISVGHLEINPGNFSAEFDVNDVPVLPTRNLVLFPGVTYPINIVRPYSRSIVENAEAANLAVAVVCQRNPDDEAPVNAAGLAQTGVLAQVAKVLPLPDDTVLAIVTAGQRITIKGSKPSTVMAGVVAAQVELRPERKPRMSQKLDNLMLNLSAAVEDAAKHAGQPLGQIVLDPEVYQKNPVMAINTVATNIPADPKTKLKLLEVDSMTERAERLLDELALMSTREEMREEIRDRARRNLGERQRTTFLEAEMESIRQELYGDADDDLSRLRQTADAIEWPEGVRERIDRELRKLDKLNPQSPDYQVQMSYLDNVMELPWSPAKETEEIDMAQAEETLQANHYGLDKVKERVLEQLALMKFAPEGHAPILCLVGPPGVGKTSLGQSIATAMGRKFQRVSLGGLHDESEIRGHRRTYIGAMPGRIIDAVRRAGTRNPVIMLDEIDKVGADYKGDPSAALLEVLDPEQNHRFHDNYIDIDFDLSKVMFITTANTLSTLSQPLLDRMEVVNLSGYSAEEKVEIARRHLLPTLLKEYGLTSEQISFTDEALMAIIENYTAESGVRRLQKQLASAMRKAVRALASGKEFDPIVTPERLHDLLGVAPMSRDRFGTDGMAGVVTGLAWTAAGGEVLYIEAITVDGKGDQLSLTGNLGDVMKESASIARRYVQANAERLGISAEAMKGRDLHIHVPEGAIPKDGPSAGITMATAIASALSGRPVRPNVAMTGELTLRGRVLPVGGIKEKMLAARRAGIKEIYISADNRRNVEEIGEEYRRDLTFHYVTRVDDVIAGALESAK